MLVKMAHNARWLLGKNEKYSIREYDELKDLLKTAKEIANRLVFHANKRRIDFLLGLIRSQLRALERTERWQQFRARYSKVEAACRKRIESSAIDPRAKEEALNLLKQLKVYQYRVLKGTAEGLEALLENKDPKRIKWKDFVTMARELQQDLQASLVIISNLKRILRFT